jgi:rfaE bifunctional protein nucleotidyltransferase chain/domain
MKNVWVNGCFDILHTGHIELLRYASGYGDNIIVGIDSDARVSQSKGSERPIITEEDRKTILESLWFVDEVVIFNDEQELRNYIIDFKIDVMVIGDDYKDKRVVGSDLVDRVVFFKKTEMSTTKIIDKILSNYK